MKLRSFLFVAQILVFRAQPDCPGSPLVCEEVAYLFIFSLCCVARSTDRVKGSGHSLFKPRVIS